MTNHKKATTIANKLNSGKQVSKPVAKNSRSRRASIALVANYIHPTEAQLDNISAVLLSILSAVPEKVRLSSASVSSSSNFSSQREVTS